MCDCDARDNLNAIAGAQGTTLDQILRANPQVVPDTQAFRLRSHIDYMYPTAVRRTLCRLAQCLCVVPACGTSIHAIDDMSSCLIPRSHMGSMIVTVVFK